MVLYTGRLVRRDVKRIVVGQAGASHPSTIQQKAIGGMKLEYMAVRKTKGGCIANCLSPHAGEIPRVVMIALIPAAFGSAPLGMAAERSMRIGLDDMCAVEQGSERENNRTNGHSLLRAPSKTPQTDAPVITGLSYIYIRRRLELEETPLNSLNPEP